MIWPYFYPDELGVACRKRGEAFAKYLSQKENTTVHVFTPEKSNIKNHTIEYGDIVVERIKNYSYFREKYSVIFSLFLSAFYIVSSTRKIAKLHPDILIASTPGPFLSLESLFIAKFLRIPFVYDMQDSWHLSQLSHKGQLKNKIKMGVEKYCATRAKLIFTVTPTLKSIISRGYNIHEKFIVVIYNGVDSTINETKKFAKTLDVIHLGSPRIYYDTLRLIDALEIVIQKRPSTSIEFMGCTDEDYVRDTISRVQEKGLCNNIKFVPPIKHEYVYYKLLKSKIGIMSLMNQDVYKSAIGVKVFEYMQAGIPTVFLGPLGGEQEKILSENKIGFSASTIDDFANYMLYLLENECLILEMGDNAKTSIRYYLWENLINDVWYSLKQICKSV